MKNSLIQVIQEAGEKVLSFYGSRVFVNKNDNSPVTKADQASNDYLTIALPQIKNIFVLSEESHVDYDLRKNFEEFWVIDPLDGTKEFINCHNDFCINIALIRNKKPVLGIIYAPILNELYYAETGCGVYYKGMAQKRIQNQEKIVAISRFHHSRLTRKFMELNNLNNTYTIGAAIKFGRMSLGLVDIYPRFEGSHEWDTAAGQIILQESGCSIVDLTTGKEPEYNKPSMKNSFFIACNASLQFNKFNIPGFI